MKTEVIASPPPAPASPGRGRAVGVVSLLTVIVAGLGFVREAALAAHFGLSTAMDAYFGAIFIPNTVQVILVVGTLSPILISMMMQDDAGGNLAKLSDTFSVVTNFALLLVGLVVSFAMLTARMWLAWLFPGFSDEAATITLHLIYIIFPAILFLALAGILTAALNGFHKFALATFAPALSSLCVIATTLLARGRWAIYLVGVATAVGFVLQMLLLIPAAASLGIRYQLILSFRHPAIRRLLRLGAPLLLYLIVANSALLVERNLASRLPVGAVATLSYAMRLFTVPSNFLAAPLAIVAYPHFAREATRESYGNLQSQVSHTFRQVLCVFLPVTLWTLVAALPLTRIIYERGQFQLQDSILTARVLQFYGIGILPNAIAVILLRCFYALQDTLTPLWAEVVDLVFYVSLAPLLTHHFGIAGLAVTRGMSFFVVTAVLIGVLRRRNGFLRIDREFLYFFSKIAAASTAMVIVCWLTLHTLQTAFAGGPTILRLAILSVVLATGAVTFLTVARVLRLREVRQIMSAALGLVPGSASRTREVGVDCGR
jgi:putative peptidoglycan lipid II flippase